MNDQHFYQPPTSINLKGLLLALLLSLPLAATLAYLYVLLSSINPIVYLGILLTVGLGIFLGFWSRAVARLTHNTNKKSQLIIAVVTSVALVYCHWVAYVLYAYKGIPPFVLYLNMLQWGFMDPAGLLSSINEINEVGMWTIGRGSSQTDNVSGGLLWLVWAIESAILLVAPILNVVLAKVYPYSTQLGKWYPKYVVNEQFNLVLDGEAFLKDFQAQPLETLKTLGLGSATRHSELTVYYLEGERQQYLEVERVYIDAENKTEKDVVVYLYKIDTPTAKQLLDHFDHTRERMEIV